MLECSEMEDLIIKFVPINDGTEVRFFAKYQGSWEYLIDQTTKAVTDALMEGQEITKLEYDNELFGCW